MQGGPGYVGFLYLVVRSLAANAVVDGRFTDDVGNVRVDGGQLEFYTPDPNYPDGTTRRCVLRHVRMSTGIVQADLTWQNIPAGIILHYQDPENFGVALVDWDGTHAALKYEECKDGHKITQHFTGTSFPLTAGQTYTLKCVITESGGAQTLTFYANGSSVLSTGRIDDSWSGGAVGLFRASSSTTTTLLWDNFKCGTDENADGDIDDVGTVRRWAAGVRSAGAVWRWGGSCAACRH